MSINQAEKRFLVTSANGDLGEASARVLCEAFPQAIIYGIDSNGNWPGQFYCSSVIEVPRGDAPDYLERLSEIIFSLKVTHLVPCSDAELATLAESNTRATLPCEFIMPQGELISTFVDKWVSHNWLETRGFPVPRTTLLTRATNDSLPLIVKPRLGSGSAGIFEVSSSDLLSGLKTEFGDRYVAQEHLGKNTPEYTCAVVAYRGRSNHIILQRKLDAGRTVMIRAAQLPEVSEIIRAFVIKSGLEGPLNIQLKNTHNGPKIFEVNPRLSSTVKMRHMLGFRDLEWIISARESFTDLPDYTIPYGASVYRLSRECPISSEDHNC